MYLKIFIDITIGNKTKLKNHGYHLQIFHANVLLQHVSRPRRWARGLCMILGAN